MNIPGKSDPAWKEILLGTRDFEFESLALKILISRLKFEIKYDQSEVVLEAATSNLQNFFVENSSLSSVQRDLSKIIGKEDLS